MGVHGKPTKYSRDTVSVYDYYAKEVKKMEKFGFIVATLSKN